MKQHELKTWGQYFQAIVSGEKTFELRKNDRDFQVGDKLLLKEYNLLGITHVTQEMKGEYTGAEQMVEVTYILKHEPMKNNFGIERGYCVMGIKKT